MTDARSGKEGLISFYFVQVAQIGNLYQKAFKVMQIRDNFAHNKTNYTKLLPHRGNPENCSMPSRMTSFLRGILFKSDTHD